MVIRLRLCMDEYTPLTTTVMATTTPSWRGQEITSRLEPSSEREMDVCLFREAFVCLVLAQGLFLSCRVLPCIGLSWSCLVLVLPFCALCLPCACLVPALPCLALPCLALPCLALPSPPERGGENSRTVPHTRLKTGLFRTALPFWRQITWNQSQLGPRTGLRF